MLNRKYGEKYMMTLLIAAKVPPAVAIPVGLCIDFVLVYLIVGG